MVSEQTLNFLSLSVGTTPHSAALVHQRLVSVSLPVTHEGNRVGLSVGSDAGNAHPTVQLGDDAARRAPAGIWELPRRDDCVVGDQYHSCAGISIRFPERIHLFEEHMRDTRLAK